MPRYRFTPAAGRALVFAADWSLPSEPDEISAVALLLGLLSESECRAARMLDDLGVDQQTIGGHWPALTRRADGERPSARVDYRVEEQDLGPLVGRLAESVADGLKRLAREVAPDELATEHVLLVLATSGGEVAAWLRGQGLSAESLGEEIRRVHGHSQEPPSWRTLPAAGGPAEPLSGKTPLPGGERAGNGAPLDVSPQPPTPAAEIERAAAPGGQGPNVRVLRVLDAAANRAGEALRTLEDYVRLVLDDRHLTGLCKGIRHELAELLQGLRGGRRLAARETLSDVGTTLETASERSRADLPAVLSANFVRLQESLRSLEEFGKLADAELSARIKQLRYRTYTLHRAVEITRVALERLAGARLYVLLDGRPSPDDFERLARSLVEAGVHIVQLRDKRLDDRQLLQRARLLRNLTCETDTLSIVNDRPDLAALSGADGVHLGQEDVSVKDARTIVGPDALIGVSTHSIEQARQAVLDGASYIGCGPTFPSGTKHFDDFPGLDLLRSIAAEVRLPAFAIGGIAAENLPQVQSAGFSRVAVSGCVADASDPPAAARQLLAALGG